MQFLQSPIAHDADLGLIALALARPHLAPPERVRFAHALVLLVVAGAVAGDLTRLTPGAAWAAALGAASLAIAPIPRLLARRAWRAVARWRFVSPWLVARVPWALVQRWHAAAPRHVVRCTLASIAVAAAVAAWAATARDAVLAPPLAEWFAAGGRAAGAPVLVDGTLLADADADGDSVRLRLRVARVNAGDGWRDARGDIQAHVGGTVAAGMADAWTRGRRVRAPVALRWPAMTYNPGAPDPQWQALVRRFALTGTIKSGALVEVERAAAWDEWAAGVRRHVRGAIARAIAPRDAQAAAIVVAILIGDRAGLDPDAVRRLQDAGTYHVIAISGGNVALVVAIVVVILRGVTRSFRAASAAALATVLAYGWVVGGEPSVERAVAAAAVYLLSNLAGLIVEPVDVLLFALLALALADPIMAVTPAVWLSFGATFAIVIGAERIASALGGRARGGSRWARVRHSALGLVAATMAAEVALAPIAASVFTRVSLAGLALNLIAIPAMAIVEIGGWAIVLAAAVPGVPSILAPPVRWATRALLESARWVEIAPWLVWRVAPSSIVWTIVFYAAVAATLIVRRPRWRLAAAGAAVLALLVIVTSPALERAAPPRGWLRVTTIDVGQGDAILVQLPTRQSLLIDAGPATDTFDTGDRVVTPALWALGVRRLDWLAFTHADLDHIGGARLVAETFRPREIWEGVPVPTDPKRAALREAAARAGRAWRQVRAGDVIEAGGATIDVLNPPAPDWERRRVRNDDSIVLRLRYGGVEWLLTGDSSREVERHWPAGDDAVAPLRVLKVAHHGSRTSTGESFVSRYAPVAAVISVGRQNVFGHPSPDVVERLARAGATVFRTDRDGAVIVETDGREIRARTWLGRRWQARMASPRP